MNQANLKAPVRVWRDSILIMGAELKVYYGNGHAIHREDPDRFSDDITEFIEEKILRTQ